MADHEPRLLAEIADILGVSVQDVESGSAGRALHQSPSGESWLLTLPAMGAPIVRHVTDATSGGHITDTSLVAFLMRDIGSAQHEALVALLHDALAAYLTSKD